MNERERRAQTFDQVAELYDRARPSYPEELFDDLFVLGGLHRGSTVLEIGCGTGKASVALARRGCLLTCIEPGAHLAAVARRNLAGFPDARVVIGAFETCAPERIAYDAVFAAASWHWLDPETRYARAARLPKPRGVLAIVTLAHAFPEGFDPIFTEIQPCYQAIGRELPKWPPPRPEEVPDLNAEIENTGLFGGVQVRRYLWTVHYSADQYVELLNTHSDHRAMDSVEREALFAGIRNVIGTRMVRKHYLAILHVASSKH